MAAGGASRRPARRARELDDQAAGDGGREQGVPACDEVDAGHQLVGRHVLEQKAAGAGAQGVVDVLVEVEGGEHQDAHGRIAVAPTIRRVASMPSISGIRMSISTTSGLRRATLSIA